MTDLQHFGIILLFISVGFIIVIWYIRSVKNRLNGRLTQLLEATDKMARAEGVVEGTEIERSKHDH